MIRCIQDNPIFRTVYEVWDSLRVDGELVPTRDKFNPMALGAALPNVVLVERVDRARYEYRVMGTAVAARQQENPVGFNMLEYFVPEVREFLAGWFEAMSFYGCGTLTSMDLVYNNDPKRAAQALGLPLLGRGGLGHYYLFGNYAWGDGPADDLGGLVSAGANDLGCIGVDIGAGLPNLPNQPTR
ncbi:PAS domain-containing protein [Kordiimonas aestuarii]|uniref:PAS domain-containing protein n=1 Tax=Kordiimonas aestuarii TaxID=1005925 RepID=UPI0021D0C0F4|nr:PAS domain-containing protein [Kordiimonas aestuarii]